ncbi:MULTISPECIES: class I adenylate-forming enzyme family protein [unclassified Streptomyces]|uniref:class I adenylate-forming enzyme family protein n=1 Tax=unclassified Streptomyces TaxID=2593676 RepID=UPI0022B5FD04|nr:MULTISPECIES: AMP-binding protein [unclassified Streptomyces]MCZ7417811.1 AMP-binding protein [Streptomyces sp. WMMC897]MCZ7432384.1 AMP-binding protein [Streptomyces sp. WMMC1477]
MWLTQILHRNRQCFPDRTAVIDAERSVTWAEFDDRTARLARGLAALGVSRGDRVAVLSVDRIEVLEAYFALARLGALFVPLNHSLTADEVGGMVRRTGVGVILGEAALLERHPELPVRLRIAVDGAEYAELTAPAADGEAAGADGGDAFRFPDVADSDLAAILHTSATTGRAKGVTVDHGSFRGISLGWLASSAAPDGMVLLNCCPLYHGSMTISLTYMAAGATIVLLPGFTPQRALAAVEEHRATHLWLVPQMLRFLLRSKGVTSTDLSSVREVLYGAAPMPVELYAEAAERLGCGFRHVYGMTEVGGPFVTLGPDEHPVPGDGPELPEVLPAGRVIPGMSARVLDPEGGELPRGAVGEVTVRGPGLMRGYWNNPAATEEITTEGWIRTGDLGFVDDEGRIHLVDRCKDLILRAGQNVYPAEIERALRTHPLVRDAAVIGVPDPDYGEVPLAYVVTGPEGATDGAGAGSGSEAGGQRVTRAELTAHLAERLAPYKRPRHVEFIDEVPRNPAGKILKKLLRA